MILYAWLKFFHMLGFISWLAGLFYLPRLFVYHVDASFRETQVIFERMERRLYNIIIVPASIVTWGAGLGLSIIQGSWGKPYFYIKIFCVFCLTMFQFSLKRFRSQLLNGTCCRSALFFRFINEIPTIFLVIILLSIIFKPFS